MLQGAWRARIARRNAQNDRISLPESLRSVEEEVLQHGYKKATWKKPVGLGSTDLELTPRSMAAAGIEPPESPLDLQQRPFPTKKQPF